MIEKCGYCQPAIDDFRQHVAFESHEKEIIAEMILAYGKLYACDEDRLTCLPLKKLMQEKDGKKTIGNDAV